MSNNLFKLLPKIVDHEFTPTASMPSHTDMVWKTNVKKFCLHLFITLNKSKL